MLIDNDNPYRPSLTASQLQLQFDTTQRTATAWQSRLRIACALLATLSMLGILFLSVATIHPNSKTNAAIMEIVFVVVGSASLFGTFGGF
jgi:hypothetical protein